MIAMSGKVKATIGLTISIVYLFASTLTDLGNYVVGVWIFGYIGGMAIAKLFKK